MSDLKRFNVRIRPMLHEFLKKQAEARGLSMNAMVILALETYFREQSVTESLPELMKAWEMENQK